MRDEYNFQYQWRELTREISMGNPVATPRQTIIPCGADMFFFIKKTLDKSTCNPARSTFIPEENKKQGREISMGNGVWWRLALTRLANNASAPHGGTCFFPNCFLCNWRGLGMGRPGTATALVCAGGS